MELETFKELGIAGIAIAALSYICYQLIKQLASARADYQSFVGDNNHTTTELVREATATMVSVRDTIEAHNKISERLLNRLDK